MTAEEERFLREFILQMKIKEVRPSYFRINLEKILTRAFLTNSKICSVKIFSKRRGTTFALTREGLLQVDALLHGFFLPQHAGARYT